jgi:hypothetical protein
LLHWGFLTVRGAARRLGLVRAAKKLSEETTMVNAVRIGLLLLSSVAATSADMAASYVAHVGTFDQEVAHKYDASTGLPDNHASSVVAAADGAIYAGTAKGLALFSEGAWKAVPGAPTTAIGPIAIEGTKLHFAADGAVHTLEGEQVTTRGSLPQGAKQALSLAASGGVVLLGTDTGLFTLSGSAFKPAKGLAPLLSQGAAINQIAIGPGGAVYLAGDSGLLMTSQAGIWSAVHPAEGNYSWAPTHVKGVAFDSSGRLWFASRQGVGYNADGTWKLFTGKEGLPYNDFTQIAAGKDGSVWFGTHKGAVKFENNGYWAYREGKRWLPDNDVAAVAVLPNGNAWFATANGVGQIERVPMTLSKKAELYEDEMENLVRRTPYGYVSELGLTNAGDKSEIEYGDSDNDGLWTSMYGAGECFAYAATKSEKAKDRAYRAFNALKYLGEVTQSGAIKPPSGYVARTIRSTALLDPNIGRLENDIRNRAESDGVWKVYEPRWPLNGDGLFYWKSDTSSDELDGHFFFYPIYFDLVADTDDEKGRVRDHLKLLIDHMIEHDFNLVDHDGTPTRWGYYSPKSLNTDHVWYAERGLKSLSMLSYLAVAAHMTGDKKYDEISDRLINDYGYANSAMIAKTLQRGVGSGNQSDDEMAYMSYYSLLKYTHNPALRNEILSSITQYFSGDEPEMNPFFNFVVASMTLNQTHVNTWGSFDVTPFRGWLEDSVETLKRFPLDRVDWRHDNSDRIDIEHFRRHVSDPIERRQGAYVTAVKEGSPAAAAGVESKQAISKVNNAFVLDAVDLLEKIRSAKAGDAVTLDIRDRRDSKQVTLTLDAAAQQNATSLEELTGITAEAILPETSDRSGIRTNGKCIPVDERFFNHWNHSPYSLTTGGDGKGLGSGAVYLLPYYMGLYHGFIVDESLGQAQEAPVKVADGR